MTTTNQNTTTKDNSLLLAQQQAEYSRESLVAHCLMAVKTLEYYAASARRDVDGAAGLKPEVLMRLPGQILSNSAWGAANASNQVNYAMQIATEYANALAKLESLKDCAR